MRRSAFSLIEMLVATVLAAVLLTAVLTMIAGVARDRKTVNALKTASSGKNVVELVRWDLSNARSIVIGPDNQSVILVSLGGVDPLTLAPNGRLVQVTYQLQRDKTLWRLQEYLDDAARPDRWQEMVASNISSFSIDPSSGVEAPVAAHSHLRLTGDGLSVDEDLWIK